MGPNSVMLYSVIGSCLVVHQKSLACYRFRCKKNAGVEWGGDKQDNKIHLIEKKSPAIGWAVTHQRSGATLEDTVGRLLPTCVSSRSCRQKKRH